MTAFAADDAVASAPAEATALGNENPVEGAVEEEALTAADEAEIAESAGTLNPVAGAPGFGGKAKPPVDDDVAGIVVVDPNKDADEGVAAAALPLPRAALDADNASFGSSFAAGCDGVVEKENPPAENEGVEAAATANKFFAGVEVDGWLLPKGVSWPSEEVGLRLNVPGDLKRLALSDPAAADDGVAPN